MLWGAMFSKFVATPGVVEAEKQDQELLLGVCFPASEVSPAKRTLKLPWKDGRTLTVSQPHQMLLPNLSDTEPNERFQRPEIPLPFTGL